MNSEVGESNFCGDCGISLKPLKGFHVSKDCDKCSKTTYFTRPSENGGFRVEKGDKVTIPPISFSFRPQKGSHLMRPGIYFLYKKILRAGYPEDHKSIKELLDYYDNQATEILKNCESLKEFNIETEDENEAQKIWDLVSKDKDSIEFLAYMVGGYSSALTELNESETKIALNAYNAATLYAMLIFRQEIEDHVWKGYLANKAIYETASASVQDPVEAEAIKNLETVFDKIDSSVLSTWIESNSSIGPKIGVTNLPEPTLLALARWHLTARDKQTEVDKFNREQKTREHTVFIKGASLGVVIVSGVLGAIWAAAKFMATSNV